MKYRRCFQVGKNVLDISYHVSQYRTIISELRDEISRLRSKMSDGRESYERTVNELPNDTQANQTLDQLLTKSDELQNLKNDIVTTFKEQMRLRRKLLNIESYLMGLEVESGRQHSLISEWEGRNNRLYKNHTSSGKLSSIHEGHLGLDRGLFLFRYGR